MAKKKSTNKQVNSVMTYRSLFATEEGKTVLYDLMKNCNFLQPCFDWENSHLTAFNEGKRDVILRILTILKTDPMEIKKFINEQEEVDANWN